MSILKMRFNVSREAQEAYNDLGALCEGQNLHTDGTCPLFEAADKLIAAVIQKQAKNFNARIQKIALDTTYWYGKAVERRKELEAAREEFAAVVAKLNDRVRGLEDEAAAQAEKLNVISEVLG